MRYIYFLCIFLCALYCYVGYSSLGFDDEFFNITIAESLSFKGMFAFLQSSDTHPPLSYLVNKSLFMLTHDWKMVRLINALVFSTSICYAIFTTQKRNGTISALLVLFLLGLQPAMLMWGTSLRWYSLFVSILIWTSYPPKKKSAKWYWAKFIIGSSLLLYTGYIGILLLPGLAWMYFYNLDGEETKKFKSVVTSMFIVFLVFLPQFLVFKNFHYKSESSQFYSILSNLQGVFISQFSNQGLFPITVFALLSAGGNMILLWAEFSNVLKQRMNKECLPYFSSLLLIVSAGLAGRFRTLIVLQPFQTIWSIELANTNRSKLKKIALALILTANVAGLVNVTKHAETTKNNWNIPMEEIISHVQKESDKKGTLVYCHDPIISYHLEKLGYAIAGPYYINKKEYNQTNAASLIVIKTYQGVISNKKYRSMFNELEKIQFKTKKTIQLGLDKHFALKQKIEPAFSKFAAEIICYKNAKNIKIPSEWEWSSGIYVKIRSFQKGHE